jgi:hypothetical protein
MGILTSQNPDTPEGLEQRLFVGIHWILAELPHSSKLEPRNPVGPQRIPIELLHSSSQNLTTLLTRLCLATTLIKRALQVESLKCGVCVDFHR